MPDAVATELSLEVPVLTAELTETAEPLLPAPQPRTVAAARMARYGVAVRMWGLLM